MIASLELIDAQIEKQSLLRTPFYQAWSRGELMLDALRDYAAQYYRHVVAFPTYLSAVHAQSDDLRLRKHLLANLMDEEAGSPNHPELWLQFAAGLGLTEEMVRRAEVWPETQELIHTFRSACGTRGEAVGVAALYAYESQIPAVAQSKIAGLKRFYGIENEKALQYFAVHEEADREHAAVESELLAERLDETNVKAVTDSVEQVLTVLNNLLFAVYRRHGIDLCTEMQATLT